MLYAFLEVVLVLLCLLGQGSQTIGYMYMCVIDMLHALDL